MLLENNAQFLVNYSTTANLLHTWTAERINETILTVETKFYRTSTAFTLIYAINMSVYIAPFIKQRKDKISQSYHRCSEMKAEVYYTVSQ